MNPFTQGVARRLALSLLITSALSGCAVYAPPNGGAYVYGTDVNGQPVYAMPPGYVAPYYSYYPNYQDPLYPGSALFFNFGIRSEGDYRQPHPGYRGGRGGFRGRDGHDDGPRRGDR